MSRDQYTFADPTTLYDIRPEAQTQDSPGLDATLHPAADLGEATYRGSGRLRGRKALVTGGDSGIGAATVIAFAREGADVVIAHLPDEAEDAERIAGIAREAGVTAVTVAGDLRERAFSTKLVARTIAELGGIDAMVLNAGAQQHNDDITTLSDGQFSNTLTVNVESLFWLAKEAVPHLAPGSTIVVTSSQQAYQPAPFLIDYATTKFAANGFVKALAAQLAPRGIRVNAVAPGPVWTPLQVTGAMPTDQLDGFGSETPLGRVGQPAELAPAYVFLSSAESSFVVAETLNVNGGTPTP